jgi:hypothetical protein
MRTPWQSFRLDLERAPVRLWAALGRLEAFGETLAQLPAAPATTAAPAARWRERAAQGAFAAEAAATGIAAIDPEVAAVVATLYAQIDGAVVAGTEAGRDILTPHTLCADNAALAEVALAAGLLDAGDGEATLADQFSEGPGSWGKLNQYCAWLNGPEFVAQPGEAIQTAVLQALGAHLFLLRLSPFRQCNDATARLAGYRVLRAAGLPAMSAHLPAAHFAATGDAYAELIAEASETGGATFAFVAYAAGGIGDGMREQIAALSAIQRSNAWRDSIADTFGGRTRAGDRRRRMLVEALGNEESPVRIGRLRYLTPNLAEAYAGKSAKTLSRDVRWLEAQGLVQRTLKGVRPLRDRAEADQRSVARMERKRNPGNRVSI